MPRHFATTAASFLAAAAWLMPGSSAATPADAGDMTATASIAEQAIPPSQGEGDKEPGLGTVVTAGYDKAFFIQAAEGAFLLKVQGRLQTRYTYEALDGARNESNFSIPRARLTMSGHTFTEALTYKLQIDFGKGFVSLKDFYADYRIVPEWVHVRAGQWKRPFSRQQITSSGKLEMADRAITDKFFAAGRDIGVAVHNDYERSPTFEYALGIFNGTGEKPWFSGNVAVDPTTLEGEVEKGSFTNVPDQVSPAIVVRAGYNHGNLKGYSEADLEGGPLRFGIAVSGLAEMDADKNDKSAIRAELDYILKLEGFSTTGSVYLSTTQSGAGFADQSYAAMGFHVQAGYVVAGWIQPLARFAMVDPDGDGNKEQEALGGVSLYFFGHSVKWQTEAGAMIHEATGGSSTDVLARSQLQLSF